MGRLLLARANRRASRPLPLCFCFAIACLAAAFRSRFCTSTDHRHRQQGSKGLKQSTCSSGSFCSTSLLGPTLCMFTVSPAKSSAAINALIQHEAQTFINGCELPITLGHGIAGTARQALSHELQERYCSTCHTMGACRPQRSPIFRFRLADWSFCCDVKTMRSWPGWVHDVNLFHAKREIQTAWKVTFTTHCPILLLPAAHLEESAESFRLLLARACLVGFGWRCSVCCWVLTQGAISVHLQNARFNSCVGGKAGYQEEAAWNLNTKFSPKAIPLRSDICQDSGAAH